MLRLPSTAFCALISTPSTRATDFYLDIHVLSTKSGTKPPISHSKYQFHPRPRRWSWPRVFTSFDTHTTRCSRAGPAESFVLTFTDTITFIVPALRYRNTFRRALSTYLLLSTSYDQKLTHHRVHTPRERFASAFGLFQANAALVDFSRIRHFTVSPPLRRRHPTSSAHSTRAHAHAHVGRKGGALSGSIPSLTFNQYLISPTLSPRPRGQD